MPLSTEAMSVTSQLVPKPKERRWPYALVLRTTALLFLSSGIAQLAWQNHPSHTTSTSLQTTATFHALAFVGTYTSATTEELQGYAHGVGIYAVRVALDGLSVVAGPANAGVNPSVIAFHPSLPIVYASNELASAGEVHAMRFMHNALETWTMISFASTPSALACDGQYLAIALYSRGAGVALYDVDSFGKIGALVATAPANRTHDVAFDGNVLWAVDIAADSVLRFQLPDLTLIATFHVPGGPRTLALPYVSLQTAAGVSRLAADRVAATVLFPQPCGDVSGLAKAPNALFVACRQWSDDTGALAVLTSDDQLMMVSSEGATPRSIALAGPALVIADQHSDRLVTLRISDLLAQLPHTHISETNLTYSATTPLLRLPPFAQSRSSLSIASPAFVTFPPEMWPITPL